MRRFSSVVRKHNSSTRTRFPTKYNPDRSAFKQKIILPPGVSYNPAPAAPTPLETPAAFLPPQELKARTFLKDSNKFNTSNMPQISESPKRTYHLTDEDAAEIAALRQSDPYKWTRKNLAAKYNVSEMVIGMLSTPNEEHSQEMDRRLDIIQSQWNDKRARARDHRKLRKMYWLRDAK
ncbi:mitochondrial 54S ribosomal protein YmL20 [Starmerella bacillaris]|uniref:Mitochondrial 54S ribosomal protein YmL20 n=1 Tax=Starmerella bacillaris TaxID=1247836 RepID=A0AAV5RFE5_STABA|nr:mitochondrial 54S ribosomal protein YmL20 [Starmerella bacillaris]